MNRNDILRVSFQGLDLDLAATTPLSQHRFETFFFFSHDNRWSPLQQGQD